MQTPEPVSLARRLGAMFYDVMLILGSILVFGVILTSIAAKLMGVEIIPPHSLVANLFSVFYVFLIIAFYTYFWTHGGQTLGMRAWKIKVVTSQNGPLDYSDALRRLAFSVPSWALFGIGFLMSLVTPDKLAWHDKVSQTKLIRTG
jgi:uncharacterized RDD family membrane protein YckC